VSGAARRPGRFLGCRFPVIGVVHLLALPGAPDYAGSMPQVVRRARDDAAALASAGCDALIVENFGDRPFWKDSVPPATVAALTTAALAVRDAATGLPLGVNCLRNDALSALSVAAAIGARFVRVNVLTGAMLTDQGVIEGRAAEVLRLRAVLAPGVQVAADVLVKHAAPLVARDPEDIAAETVERGGADALIVTGRGTGAPVDLDVAARVRSGAGGRPVLAGSGATVRTVGALTQQLDGVIVGTSIKRGGRTQAAVSATRAEKFVAAVHEALER